MNSQARSGAVGSPSRTGPVTDSGAPSCPSISSIPPVSEAVSVAVTHQTRQPRARALSAVASATVDLPIPPIPVNTHAVPRLFRRVSDCRSSPRSASRPRTSAGRRPSGGTTGNAPRANEANLPAPACCRRSRCSIICNRSCQPPTAVAIAAAVDPTAVQSSPASMVTTIPAPLFPDRAAFSAMSIEKVLNLGSFRNAGPQAGPELSPVPSGPGEGRALPRALRQTVLPAPRAAASASVTSSRPGSP